MIYWEDSGPISAFPIMERTARERRVAIAQAQRDEPTYWAQVASSGRTLATDVREDR